MFASNNVPLSKEGVALPLHASIPAKSLAHRFKVANGVQAERKSTKCLNNDDYKTLSINAQLKFFFINIKQEIKVEHADLFTDSRFFDILDEKHHRNGVESLDNYFFLMMENLCLLKKAVTTVSFKPKKTRPVLKEAPKDNSFSQEFPLPNGTRADSHSKESGLIGAEYNITNETITTTVTVKSHSTSIAQAQKQTSPKTRPQRFKFNYHDIILNSAELANEIALAHCNARARNDAYSFQYEEKMFAFQATLSNAIKLVNHFKNREEYKNIPAASKVLSDNLNRFQNSLENSGSRFVREHQTLISFVCGMTALIGLGMIVGGLMLSPLNPVAGLHLIIAGGCVGTTGFAGLVWPPMANLLVAPNPELAEVKRKSSLTVKSFHDLISSSTTFFSKNNFTSVIAGPLPQARTRARPQY
jgi:hypothetical protein